MMKKMYNEPQTEEILLEMESVMLSGSPEDDVEGFTPPDSGMPNPGNGGLL